MASGAYYVCKDPECERGILFQIAPEFSGEIPEEQSNLYRECEKVSNAIDMIFPTNNQKYQEYFVPLLSLAQAGLVGANANPNHAKKALEILKQNLIDKEGWAIKNGYLKKLGIICLYAISFYVLSFILLRLCFNEIEFSNFSILLCGCCIGIWLSFAMRKVVLSFEDIYIIEKDQMEPIIRLIYANILCAIIFLGFNIGFIKLNIGSIPIDATNGISFVFLIGCLLGVSEQTLSSRIFSSSTKLVKM